MWVYVVLDLETLFWLWWSSVFKTALREDFGFESCGFGANSSDTMMVAEENVGLQCYLILFLFVFVMDYHGNYVGKGKISSHKYMCRLSCLCMEI